MIVINVTGGWGWVALSSDGRRGPGQPSRQSLHLAPQEVVGWALPLGWTQVFQGSASWRGSPQERVEEGLWQPSECHQVGCLVWVSFLCWWWWWNDWCGYVAENWGLMPTFKISMNRKMPLNKNTQEKQREKKVYEFYKNAYLGESYCRNYKCVDSILNVAVLSSLNWVT